MKLFLQQIFSTFLKWICEFFPKNKKMILIGTPNAIDYYDNSKYFFEFLYKNEANDFSFFLITKNKKSYTHLKNKFGDQVLYAFSFKAIMVYLRSKFVLLVNGNGDIFPFTPTNKKQVVINMWHAITFKNVGHLSKAKTTNKINLDINYFLVSSESERESMIRAYSYPEETFKIFGTPRNDIFFIPENRKRKADGKTKILYLPTFRDHSSVNFFPFADLDLKTFNDFLETKNIEILIKPHKNDSTNEKLLGIIENSPNIILKTSANTTIDIQHMLLDCDILLTDYSSVYFDFLLLDRPIIYIPYDLEQYKKERGLLFDFEEVTCGDKVFTQKEFIESLTKNIENPAKDTEIRAAIRNRFHQHNDGQASERLFNFIKNYS
jgi:CDP-glycerol glycerophosphotransferase (TagB/SpsB family)